MKSKIKRATKNRYILRDGQKVYAVIQEEITKTCPTCGHEEKANGKWKVIGPGIINVSFFSQVSFYSCCLLKMPRKDHIPVWICDVYNTKKEAQARADKENKELQC